MHDARVLVVDDSAAMRALFTDILEQSKNVEVLGAASNADEAREMIEKLHPNVLTLDVEMPGMSGMEFLEEIMEHRPMPVVMLSSLTQKGTEISLKALELGAVECFPKPLKVSMEQFNEDVSKLGRVVLSAANSKVRSKAEMEAEAAASAAAAEKAAAAMGEFVWNGKMIALSAAMGGIEVMGEILRRFPENCPPTLVVLQTEPAMIQAFVARMDKEVVCQVKEVVDGTAIEQGNVYLAADPLKHVVIEPGAPPKIRLIDRPAIDGIRPCANLMYGTLARANAPAVAAVLTGMGTDGADGLKLMKDAGHETFVQSPETALVAAMPQAAIAAGAAKAALSISDLATVLIKSCNLS